jgi:hypothetical protein
VRLVDEQDDFYGGTCFAFRQPHIALTAAHCIPTDAQEVWVQYPRRGDRRKATNVIRHSEADVAVIFTSPDENDDGTGYPEGAFWNCVGNWGMGEEFLAYGFPTEGPFQTGDAPTPRIFVGHYQRFLRFGISKYGRYLAGEMSIPAPAGLSGGPVFRRGAPQMLTGLVTSNLESYSVLHAIEEVEQSGQRFREESRRVIQYGLVAMLSDIESWLDELIPHRLGTAHSRG